MLNAKDIGLILEAIQMAHGLSAPLQIRQLQAKLSIMLEVRSDLD